MIVRCITEETGRPLSLNKLYNVYGMSITDKGVYVLICEDHYDGKYINFPMFLSLEFFDIANPDLSMFWISKIIRGTEGYETLIGVEEIIKNDYFFYNILEGNDEEILLFQKCKKLIDDEYFKYYDIVQL